MLSEGQARRIALAAQGFGRERGRTVTMRQVQRVISQVAQFQVDSVNVCVRAHYMPLYSRLGPYDRAVLDRAVNAKPRRVYEFWGTRPASSTWNWRRRSGFEARNIGSGPGT